MTYPKVFICHASEDKDRFVVRFAERLRSKGIDAWLDKWEMFPGDKLVDKVFNEGLKPSDAVIVVLSDVSIKQPWVRKELDVAVVKNIEDRTRLIPVRLDYCAVPECLRDTIWQDIPDLDSYDIELERIINVLHGQFDRPPLGKAPAHVNIAAVYIGDLTPIDSVVFEHACRLAIAQGHPSINGETLVSDLKERDISESQIMETQEMLEGRSYIETQRVMGPPHVYGFTITNYGFGKFAQVGVQDFAKTTSDVARCLVREVLQEHGQTSKHSIAEELAQPRFIIEHILETFGNQGLIKYGTSLGGDLYMEVFWVSPEVRRALERMD